MLCAMNIEQNYSKSIILDWYFSTSQVSNQGWKGYRLVLLAGSECQDEQDQQDEQSEDMSPEILSPRQLLARQGTLRGSESEDGERILIGF